jgi:hypothetical protein
MIRLRISICIILLCVATLVQANRPGKRLRLQRMEPAIWWIWTPGQS